MALTLGNFVGFETGGLEEAVVTGGTPDVQSTTVRTGSYSLELTGGNDSYGVRIIQGGASDAGNKYIVGFAIRFSSLSQADNYFFWGRDTVGICFSLRLKSNGDLLLRDANGVDVVTVASPFTVDTWHYIEILWEHLASGSFILYIDSLNRMNRGGVDLTSGGTLNDDTAFYRFLDMAAETTVHVDDVYCMSGATSPEDFLGDAEVFRYQNRLNSATPDAGDALAFGIWQDVGETPLSEANTIEYTASAASGDIFTDDTASGQHGRHGPHGDGSITGDIKGAKWLHRLKRNGGGGTTHYKRYGNDAEAESEAVVLLSTAYQNFFTISEAAAVVPLSTEHFSMGIRVDGAQDMHAAEIWAFILHVPSVGPEILIDWLVQHPDPRRRPPELVSEGLVGFLRLIELSEIDIGWLVQHPDPVRSPGTVPIAVGETFVVGAELPLPVPDIGWLPKQVEPERKPEPVHEGLLTFPRPPPSEETAPTDWLVQHPDPVRRSPELVSEGFAAFTRLVELSEVPIDWLVEPTLVTRPPLRLVPGESFFLRLIALSEIPIDWLVQQPDPRRRPPELVPEGQMAFLRLVGLDEVPIDWLIQHPDPRRRPPELVSEGWLAFTRLVTLDVAADDSGAVAGEAMGAMHIRRARIVSY